MYHNTDDYLRGIHRSPVDSPHKGSQGGKCFHAMASSCNTCTPWPFWSVIQSQAINLDGHIIYYVLYTTTLGHCWRKHERLWLRVHRYGCTYSVLPCRKAVLHLSSLRKKYVYHHHTYHRENPRSTSNISCLITALNVSKPLCRWYLINVQKCEHLFHLREWSILLMTLRIQGQVQSQSQRWLVRYWLWIVEAFNFLVTQSCLTDLVNQYSRNFSCQNGKHSIQTPVI